VASLTPFVSADYLSPTAFSVNLMKCMSNDWKFDVAQFWRLFFPSSVKQAGEAAGVEVTLDYVEQEHRTSRRRCKSS